MKTRLKKIIKRQSNKGSALIIAIIVSIVLMVLCLSLLLVSYSLIVSTQSQVIQDQCKEMAQSISLELEKELTSPAYSSYEEQAASMNHDENQLWFYVRYHLRQDSWKYYNEDELGHGREQAFKYYSLDVEKNGVNANLMDSTVIYMYWESDGEREATFSDYEDHEDTPLFVAVTCSRGGESYTVVTEYALSATLYPDANITQRDTGKSTINQEGHSVVSAENWRWTFMQRR